ncbi:sialidase family protein [Sphingomonas sp. Tas61C01]|uniref:sialidase family protein n=1 Tax=Sphingomonas sp. Tas61C01 TaxID=3458297 RepID=UPI00403E9A46
MDPLRLRHDQPPRSARPGGRLVTPMRQLRRRRAAAPSDRYGESRMILAKYVGMVVAALVALSGSIGTTQTQTRLTTDPSMYARARQLANGEILAAMTGFAGGKHIDVYVSADAGVTFRPLSRITDPDFGTGLCCGTIFQLPRAIGKLPAGTLLWSGSIGQDGGIDRRMTIKIYMSADDGRTWRFLSAIASLNAGGLWEPELSVAEDGALVMMYSDETNRSIWDQKLVATRSYDGARWQDTKDLVASTVRADRPGMAVVSRLARGTRFMTYELCGPAACATFLKTSNDGWNWGNATQAGTAIRLPDGRHFVHAPYNTVLSSGPLLVVGQMLMKADGTVAAGNGTTIFKSASGNPAGPWTTIAAPVGVPGARDHPCPNYSSPLLSLAEGATVLEFSGRLEGDKCVMYFNRGPTR